MHAQDAGVQTGGGEEQEGHAQGACQDRADLASDRRHGAGGVHVLAYMHCVKCVNIICLNCHVGCWRCQRAAQWPAASGTLASIYRTIWEYPLCQSLVDALSLLPSAWALQLTAFPADVFDVSQGLNTSNAVTAFERMEEKVMALEAEAESTLEVCAHTIFGCCHASMTEIRFFVQPQFFAGLVLCPA